MATSAPTKEGEMAKGMGFKAAAKSVSSREHIPVARANAIIAAGARGASAKAKRSNPNLRKVKGG